MNKRVSVGLLFTVVLTSCGVDRDSSMRFLERDRHQVERELIAKRFDDALKSARRERTRAEEINDPFWEAAACNDLGDALSKNEQKPEAMKQYFRAVQLANQELPKNAAAGSIRRQLFLECKLRALESLALVQKEDDAEAAATSLKQSCDVLKELALSNSRVVSQYNAQDLVRCLALLFDVDKDAGNRQAAKEALSNAIELAPEANLSESYCERLRQQYLSFTSNGTDEKRPRIAAESKWLVLTHEGVRRAKMKDPRARDILEEALQQAKLAGNDRAVIVSYRNLARVCTEVCDFRAVRKYCRDGLVFYDKTATGDNDNSESLVQLICNSYMQEGRFKTLKPWQERRLAFFKEHYAEDSVEVAHAESDLALVCCLTNDKVTGRSLADHAYNILMNTGADGLNAADAMHRAASPYVFLHQPDKAVTLLEHACTQYENSRANQSGIYAIFLADLIEVYAEAGQLDKAKKKCEQLVAVIDHLNDKPSWNPRYVVQAAVCLLDNLRYVHQPQLGLALRDKIQDIVRSHGGRTGCALSEREAQALQVYPEAPPPDKERTQRKAQQQCDLPDSLDDQPY